jgi:hypothetical protein
VIWNGGIKRERAGKILIRLYEGGMRPEELNPLFVGAEALKGVGAGLAKPLAKLGLNRIAISSIICPTVSSAAGCWARWRKARWASR